MINVDEMLATEIARRWPDMSEAERAERADAIRDRMQEIADEWECVIAGTDVAALQRLQDTLGALSATMAEWPTPERRA